MLNMLTGNEKRDRRERGVRIQAKTFNSLEEDLPKPKTPMNNEQQPIEKHIVLALGRRHGPGVDMERMYRLDGGQERERLEYQIFSTFLLVHRRVAAKSN